MNDLICCWQRSFDKLLSVITFTYDLGGVWRNLKKVNISKMELVGNVKNYDWGKLGIRSVVAQLAQANDEKFKVNDQTPYSELWMGAHTSGPSTIKSNGQELSSVIKEDLPFLFKVLSIRKALSIQVHPNKEEAERLHAERPDIYKDPNHKPELAIALTPFLALCGFRAISEIRTFIEELPPLKSLVGEENVEALKLADSSESLKLCYEKLMTSPEKSIANCIKDIATNYSSVLEKHELLDVFTKINGDFTDDVGVLSIFFINLLRLQPGQAIFLAANEIHAYLDGDCVECMACSDNVIRAGLTPKYKDVDQLISCLNYEGGSATRKIFIPYRIDENVQVFVPPVKDFAVTQITLPHVSAEYKLQIQNTGSILLTLQGSRKLRLKTDSVASDKTEILLKRGSIIYIPPQAAPEVEFVPVEDCGENFVAYMATSNTFKN